MAEQILLESSKTPRKTAIRFDPVNPAITVFNSRYLRDRMVVRRSSRQVHLLHEGDGPELSI